MFLYTSTDIFDFYIFLSNVQYSLFGSIMTIGAIIGALLSGKMTDVIGRRYVCFSRPYFYKTLMVLSFSTQKSQAILQFLSTFINIVKQTFWILDIFYIMGWLSIIFAKVSYLPLFIIFQRWCLFLPLSKCGYQDSMQYFRYRIGCNYSSFLSQFFLLRYFFYSQS